METILANSRLKLNQRRPSIPHVVYSSGVSGSFHLHSKHYSAKIVLEGEEHYTGDFGNRSIVPGRILLTTPNTTLRVNIKRRTKGFCAFFDASTVVDSLWNEIGYQAENPELLWPLVLPIDGSRFARELQVAAASDAQLDHDYFCTLFAHSLKQSRELLSRLPQQKISSKQDLITRLEWAKAYVHSNLSQPITVEEIAEKACMSKHHLIRCFSAAYGAPPLRYSQNLKLDMARDEICEGMAVRIVAELAGFSSVSAFSRAYRRRHGHPPSKDTPK